MFYKPENYIEPTDLLKNLHSMYEDPDQLMVKGVIDNDTNMLKRENITTLLSYILLVHSNTVQNRTFAIWKYSTPKEGDGRIDIIENRNNFSLIKSSLNIEQVYIKNNSLESTT